MHGGMQTQHCADTLDTVTSPTSLQTHLRYHELNSFQIELSPGMIHPVKSLQSVVPAVPQTQVIPTSMLVCMCSHDNCVVNMQLGL